MNPAKQIFLLILSCCLCLLVLSCSLTIPVLEQEGWKQFAAAADAQPERPGEVGLHFAWAIPKKRLLMLARLNEEQVVLYQIDNKAGLMPDDEAKQVNCYFEKNQLYCVGPGEATPSAVVGSGTDLWRTLEAHAAEQMHKLTAHGQASLQARLEQQPAARVDLTRQRHPFEWGGEHETVENAQAFLEAVTAQGTHFRSSWPKAPWLGSQGNAWQNESDLVTFKTIERCLTLASSASRTAIHYNHDFWAADTVKFQAVYSWQQPIDWRGIGGVKADDDGVFFHGRYAGSFQGQALAYISGWSPSIITANASSLEPSEYSVAEWNVHLLLPDTDGLRARVLYAVTYLDIMCGKG